MKSTISFLPLLISGVATSELLSCFSGHGQQAILDNKYPVKGTDLITLCDHPDKYSLKIDMAHLDVKTFGYVYFVTFDADLNFTEEVDNATLKQWITLGSNPPMEQTEDFCPLLGFIGLHCPIPKSLMKPRQKMILLPRPDKSQKKIKVEISPKDKKPQQKSIICLEATLPT